LTTSNITFGFVAAEMSPFNPNIFTDNDFSAGFVTDRPGANIRQKDPQEMYKASSKQPSS